MKTPDTAEQAAKAFCEKHGLSLYYERPFAALIRDREEAARREGIAAAFEERHPCACGEDTFRTSSAIKFGGRCYNCRQREELRVVEARAEGWKAALEAVARMAGNHFAVDYDARDRFAADVRALPLPEMPDAK